MGQSVIGAEALADLMGVPTSVLTFLETRLPEVRALQTGSMRAYRAADAWLLAGLADLMYAENVTFRDAAAQLRGAGRAAVLSRGRELLGDAVASPPVDDAARAIPLDAVVGTRVAPAFTRRRTPSPETAAVLGELIDCVRLLEDARGYFGDPRG